MIHVPETPLQDHCRMAHALVAFNAGFEMKKWKKQNSAFGSNETLEGDGFWVSYNPYPCMGLSFFASDTGGPETALCKDGDYFILNGDFRDSYEKLVPKGWRACKQFFDQQSAHAESSWSDK